MLQILAASEATVGSHLMTADGESAAVTRVVASVAEVINPVTATGTILASDDGAPVLAASHPIWIAPLLVENAAARAVANAAMYVAGDVVDALTFAGVVILKARLGSDPHQISS